MKLAGADNGPVLTGDVINDARSDVDQTKGGWEVTMYMNPQGAQKWKEVTAEADRAMYEDKRRKRARIVVPIESITNSLEAVA